MTGSRKDPNLARVKTTLAEKYERLAELTGSKPRQKVWMLRAHRYRRQARQAAGEQP